MSDMNREVICEERGRAGFVKLNRPRALNAVTHGMIRDLDAFIRRCFADKTNYGIVIEGEGKAFSAGGDIRGIYENGRSNFEAVAKFYADEYQYNWTLERFRKPHVALIDGVVMGGGVGISLYGTHRVGGAGYRFAMPETGIGFFPDVGGSWFLPRLPGKMGLYLGLTGTTVGPADAHHFGLITHCVERSRFEDIKSGMSEGEPIDILLNALHQMSDPGPLQALQPAIDRLFAGPALEAIFNTLEEEQGAGRDFAQETLANLKRRSPLSLKVTFEQLKRGKAYAKLKDALVVEYRLAMRFLREPDLYEGIRALLIDKTNDPKWDAKSIFEISDDRVQALFAPRPEGDLTLTDL